MQGEGESSFADAARATVVKDREHQPRWRYRLGRPVLRFVVNQLFDRLMPNRLSSWYSNASPRVCAFLYHHAIYTPAESAPRIWDIPLFCGKSVRFSDQQDPGLRQLALGYGLLDRTVTQAIVQILATDHRAWLIDAGAHIGHMSIDALAMGKSVLAIEPDRSAADSLDKLFGSLAQEPAHVCRSALSKSRGRASFEFVPYGDLNRLSMLPAESKHSTRMVETIDLDGLIEDVGVPMSEIALVKMDIEGGEVDALAGARRLLETGRPSLIVELLNHQTRIEIARSLHELNYSMCIFSSAQVPLFREITLDEAAEIHEWNYCFFQPAMIEALIDRGLFRSDGQMSAKVGATETVQRSSGDLVE